VTEEQYTAFRWIIEGMLSRAAFEIEQADYLSPEYASMSV
jgi:hypothetical protein